MGHSRILLTLLINYALLVLGRPTLSELLAFMYHKRRELLRDLQALRRRLEAAKERAARISAEASDGS